MDRPGGEEGGRAGRAALELFKGTHPQEHDGQEECERDRRCCDERGELRGFSARAQCRKDDRDYREEMDQEPVKARYDGERPLLPAGAIVAEGEIDRHPRPMPTLDRPPKEREAEPQEVG